MKLRDLLSDKKTAILKRWFDKVLETYPSDTTNFLKKQKNSSANPVGSTIFNGLEKILDKFLQGTDFDSSPDFLDNIIRIRAVQDFTPSQALHFIFLLKKAVSEELKEKIFAHNMHDELSALEDKIDSLALLAFDNYMKCREKIYELKANEVQRWTFRQVQKANQIYGSHKSKHDFQFAERKEVNK